MNDLHGPSPDVDAERVRRLLDDAVADVEPRGGLEAIRARTARAPRRSRRWVWGAGATVLVTAATVTAVALFAGGPGTTGARPPGFAHGSTGPATPDGRATGTTQGAPSPTDGPSGETRPSHPRPSGSPDQAPAATPTVPVYYAGSTSRGPRLFREFHPASLGDSSPGARVAAAVNEALSGAPADPDYRSLWPDGTTAQVGHDGPAGQGTWSVRLSNDRTDLRERPAGMSRTEAALALQQVVYTVQGAAQDAGRAPVRLSVDGAGSTVLGEPASDPVAAGDSAETLAQVWVIDPANGENVGSPFTVHGLANAFEATVVWELRQGGRVVRHGFTTADECCTMAPYSFAVTAPAGRYTLVVHDTDPSGGEGFAPWEDTKRVTVR